MSSDAKALNDTLQPVDSGGMAPQPADAASVDALDSIGYEAADPVLQSPLWSEAIEASLTAHNRR
jgi:hypothetical protein